MARAIGDMAQALQFFAEEAILVSAEDMDDAAHNARQAWEDAYDAS